MTLYVNSLFKIFLLFLIYKIRQIFQMSFKARSVITPLMISVQDFAFRGRPVSLLAASLLRVGKAEGLCSEAGGIRRIVQEGVLCLLGRVDL
jgi:hypothetical protein